MEFLFSLVHVEGFRHVSHSTDGSPRPLGGSAGPHFACANAGISVLITMPQPHRHSPKKTLGGTRTHATTLQQHF